MEPVNKKARFDSSSSSSSDDTIDDIYEEVEGTDVEDTIAEEEALEQELTPEEELRLLREDMDTCLPDLLRYGSAFSLTSSAGCSTSTDSAEPPRKRMKKSNLNQLYDKDFNNSQDHQGFVCDDYDEDKDFVPLIAATNQKIRIGKDYQCDLDYTIGEKSPNGDSLMWKPNPNLSNEQVEEYLSDVYRLTNVMGKGILPPDDDVGPVCQDKEMIARAHEELLSRTNENPIIKDDVQALKKLMESNCNVSKTLEDLANPPKIVKINDLFSKAVTVQSPVKRSNNMDCYESDDNEPPAKALKNLMDSNCDVSKTLEDQANPPKIVKINDLFSKAFTVQSPVKRSNKMDCYESDDNEPPAKRAKK